MSEDARRAIEAVWRIEAAKLIAGLARLVRDVGLAEELAQDALVAALETWPRTGVPDNPGAWLMAAAKNRALDQLRRYKMLEQKHVELAAEMDLAHDIASRDRSEAVDAALDDEIGDDLLRLVFTACHPVLSPEARVALTLKLVGGLTTAEIARAYLAPEPTIAQRLVRAKRTLSEARVPFEVPRGAELEERLASVLEVIYLVFNEGYAATSGETWARPELCDEGLRLGRILAGLMPDEREVHGLVALMEIQASRLHSRVGPNGEPVLLMDQDRSRSGMQLLIRRGLAALDRAESLGGTLGPYTLQAAIAACHARARARLGDGLGADRRALRCALAGHALTRGGAESGGGGGDGFRAGGGTGDRRLAAGRAHNEGLPPAAKRTGGLPEKARPERRSQPGLEAGSGVGEQRTRAGTAAGTGIIGTLSFDDPGKTDFGTERTTNTDGIATLDVMMVLMLQNGAMDLRQKRMR